MLRKYVRDFLMFLIKKVLLLSLVSSFMRCMQHSLFWIYSQLTCSLKVINFNAICRLINLIDFPLTQMFDPAINSFKTQRFGNKMKQCLCDRSFFLEFSLSSYNREEIKFSMAQKSQRRAVNFHKMQFSISIILKYIRKFLVNLNGE